MGNLLMRGMLAGLIASLLAFGFAKVYGEPQVDRAIAFEEHESHAAPVLPKSTNTHTRSSVVMSNRRSVY